MDLVAELSQNPKSQKEVISLIPLIAQAAHFKHYTQHLHLLETVCTQVTNFIIMTAILHYCFSWLRYIFWVQGNNRTVLAIKICLDIALFC